MTTHIDIHINRRSVLAAAGVLALGSVAALTLAAPKARVIKVVAKKFEYVPSEIHVKRGESVMLEFTALEVPMGFSLPDFGTPPTSSPARSRPCN